MTRSFTPDADTRLAAIVDSSFDAIISKDLNSVITTWNGAAERLFGYTADEAVGRSILMLIPESFLDEEVRIISQIRRGERVPSFDTIRTRKDGSFVAVSVTVSPIKNTNGDIVGASKIARDITAAKENERRIKMLMREVNHRVKNQFAVILSMVRETSKRSSGQQDFEERIRERIMALSRSHDLLVTSDWAGANVTELVLEHLKPFVTADRFSVSGPLVNLVPNAVQHLGMAFHELATNSAKYGAFAGPDGRVDVSWTNARDEAGKPRFQLVWNERFHEEAEAEEKATTHKGFGAVVLLRVAPQSISGTATLERSPGQLQWTITAPLDGVIVEPDLE